MSLHDAAKHLAAQGRGPDKTLVHMSPRELSSLQKLAMAHGGNLTVNPKTGLPEAGFLDSLLPTIIGAGVIAATGGAAAPEVLGMSMPTALGVGIGGLETMRTGNLSKGLMAGLGAYGGAGLATSLSAMGTQEAVNEATKNMPGMFEQQYASSMPEYEGMTQEQANAIKTAREAEIAKATANPMQTLGKGLQAAAQSPGSFLSQNYGKIGAALAPSILGMGTGAPPATSTGGPNPYQYRYQANTTTPTPQPDVPNVAGLGQDFGRQQHYFAGQYVPVKNAVDPTQPIFMAEGGTANLGDYSDGGHLLRGPGDGVSDSIPATIGGKRPARLADGEFVVPARIVSELGNGSTEAGARKLYAMMDRVQKARGKTVGKGKIAANTKADKFLPV